MRATLAVGIVLASALAVAVALIGLADQPPASSPTPDALWMRQLGSDQHDGATSLAVDASGSVYLAGWTDGQLRDQRAAGARDAFLVKLGPDATPRWTRQFGSPAVDAALAVSLGPSGEVQVTIESGAPPEALLRAYTPDGAERSTRPFDRPIRRSSAGLDLSPAIRRSSEEIRGVARGPEGERYLVGLSDPDHGHAFLRKHDPAGAEVWSRELHLGGAELLPVALLVDASGHIYLAAQTAGRAVVRQYDPYGAELWTAHLIASGRLTPTALAVTPTGAVYLAGWTSGTLPGQRSAGQTDAFVARLR